MIVDTDAKRAVRLAELHRMNIKGMPLGPTLADLVRAQRAVYFVVIEDPSGMRETQPRYTSDWLRLMTRPDRATVRSRVITFLDEVDEDDELKQLVRQADIDLDYFREGLAYDA